jgi:hypothetical protein
MDAKGRPLSSYDAMEKRIKLLEHQNERLLRLHPRTEAARRRQRTRPFREDDFSLAPQCFEGLFHVSNLYSQD